MTFINVEGELVTALGAETALPVATGPQEDGAEFLVIRRTGGPARLKVTDQPLFVVESYAKFEDTAIANLNPVREYLIRLRRLGTAHVKFCREVGGPANLPDPLLPLYSRYTSTFEMHLRA